MLNASMAHEEWLKVEQDKKEIKKVKQEQRMINKLKRKIVLESEMQGTAKIRQRHEEKVRNFWVMHIEARNEEWKRIEDRNKSLRSLEAKEN